MPKHNITSSRFCQGRSQIGRRCRHRIHKPRLFCNQHHTQLSTRDVTPIIQSYLNQTIKTKGRKNKIKIVHRLFDFLVDQKHFVSAYPNFALATRAKLVEFYHKEGLKEMDMYHQALFQEPLPHPIN